MEKAYDPGKHEARIYKMWEDSGAFKPEGNPHLRRESPDGSAGVRRDPTPFSIIMPPPNANGDLHAGHAMYVLEDIMIRYARMLGRPTLWLPGTDHAGIETQVVFERELAKQGKSRFDFSPSEFYGATMKFVKKNEGNMLSQMRSLGLSADWSRKKFTLDPDIIEIVYDTFKRLHDDGLVYRANRIVNWCPRCNAAFADLEISYRQQTDPLYYIKYGPFVLATVRPETKFGDTAVAVHPKDERYKKFIGKDIDADGLLGKFKLKVIADEYVNPDFGTGVIKVTPAHDPNDWEIGQRHNLEVKQAVGTDGRLTAIAGKYAGMKVMDAREETARDLEAMGLIDHIDMNYTHNVGYHDRCGTQIEPLVTEQWWLDVKELKKPAIKAIKDGEIVFVPSRFRKQALDWLEGLRDWNISRQIWWGIRVPVYYNASGDKSKKPYIIASHETEAEKYYGKGNYEAETDTFDTWFSSGQWPFATLMATGDFDQFYPTAVMGTMRDILYLWVTRMIMFGLYRTGQVPFRTVYLWGAVNDAHGKKMSKSKGNVINPLEMTAKFGTDALRLALIIGVTAGTGGSISEKKIEGYRNFNNKLWNVARFILDKAGNDYSPAPPKPDTLADFWILDRVSQETAAITKAIEGYRFSEAGERVYSLLWNDLADWYLEASKSETNTGVLVYCLETILKLAHPFAPFVTEAIWQKMALPAGRQVGKNMLITGPWPKALKSDQEKAGQFEEIMALVRQIRSISVDLALSNTTLVSKSDLINAHSDLIKRLANLSEIKAGEETGLAVPGCAGTWLDISAGQVREYVTRLERKRDAAGEYLRRLEEQLGNRRYVDSAPPELVRQTRQRRDETKRLQKELDEQIKAVQV